VKVHQAVAKAFRDNGVDTMFGLLGDGNMFTSADFVNDEAGRFIAAVSEGGALVMADAYARVTGMVGVASVTHGPGAANTINAMIESVRAHTPVVLFTADTPARRGHAQHIDLNALFHATGAEYHRIMLPEHAVDDIAIVLNRVTASRRPAVIDIPIDLQMQDVDYEPSTFTRAVATSSGPSDEDLDEALGMLLSANRPLILAGRGAVLAGAGPALRELADLLGAPLATSASGKDLFNGHPYAMGVVGNYGVPWAGAVMAKSDCVAVFGAGLNNYTTANGDLLQGRVIHIDAESQNIGRFTPVDIAISADANQTALAMVEQLREAGIQPKQFRTNQLGEGVHTLDPSTDFKDRSTPTTVDSRTAMLVLEEILPADKLVVTDGGRFIVAPWRYSHVENPRHFIHPGAWGSIGLGTAAVVGAAMARPDLLAVAICGDGGGMMGMIEFSTAVRHNARVLMVVLNDNAYGAELPKLERAGYDPRIAHVEWPEFADVAIALGGDGVTVRNLDQLRAIEPLVNNLTRPLLVDIKVDPTVDPINE
jgi:thiamine pyrophosphate-dependent acetolactate synthase large subunit-like protein